MRWCTCWISFAPAFSFIYYNIQYNTNRFIFHSGPNILLSPYLCFISLLYLDLYVLGDDALISKGSFMQTKYLCVLIHICLSPPVKYFTDRSKAVLLLWIFYIFVLSCVCYAFVSVCLCVPCGYLLGKG